MSAVPGITQRILDGGLGIPATTPDLLHCKVGVCSGGIRNKPRLVTDVAALVAQYRAGPLVDSAAHHIDRTGSVWIVRTNTSTNGTIGAVTKIPAGVATGALTATFSTYTLHASIPAGGPLSVLTGWVKLPIPGKVTISLAAPGVATVYTLTGKGLEGELQTETISLGVAPSSNTSLGEYTEIISLTTPGDPMGATTVTKVEATPVDAYEVIVEIMKAGSVAGVSFTYRYSLDLGRTFSPTLSAPAGGVVDIQSYAPGSDLPFLGFKITFTDGGGPAFFLLGDKFTFETTAPTWTLSDVLTGMDAIALDTTTRSSFSGYHLVGPADGTIYSSVEAQLSTYADKKFLYRWAYLESVRQGATLEATWAAAVVTSFATTGVRTGVVAMDMDIFSPALRTFNRRNMTTSYIARLMACPISELPSHVDCETVFGTKTALEGVTRLYQGDASVETLTLANIVTARTYTTRTGFYITRSVLKTLDTSDYRDITNRRVMDVAATVGYDATLSFLQSTQLANPATGRLADDAATNIAATVKGKLNVPLQGGQRRHVSDLDVQVSTANPFLQDRTIFETIKIVPRGAVDFIQNTYSFTPSLT